MEAAQQSQLSPQELLAKVISLYDRKTALKKELEEAEAAYAEAKVLVQDLFIQMGVKQMKATKTVYLAKQIWAGAAQNVTNLDVAHALEKLNLSDYVTFNHQSLSGYVREITKQHTEWFDRDGDLIADVDQIIKELPEPLNKLLKVTEKIDIRVRK